ncbi:hypothetical protein QN277_000869 [Acacia crassicarpa]|uniref:Uncharacterized protein n=1 Tax=Acacia crassicarpa TaxID=499986 RepID=A0AAE1N689_9FABA|nr:hypothetical protein QN277_000869 [Acacia crassicarpa]
MKVAVKYFDQRGRHGREVLEQMKIKLDARENADDAGGDDSDDALPLMKKKENEEEEVEMTINNEVLDLNAMALEANKSDGV